MLNLLKIEDFYSIIACGTQYPLEDYIHYVKSDTPDFIEKLRKSLTEVRKL